MMKGALKRMGSAPKLRLPSSKSRSGTFDDGAAQPAGVTFQVSGALVGGVDLGGEPASAEQHIMLLEQQLREKTRRLEEAERQLIASTPSRQIQSEMKTVPPLPAGGTSSEALAWLRAACNRSAVTPEVFKMLLLALRENLAYDHLGLPRDDEDLFEYAARMHMLGDIDRDDLLSDRSLIVCGHGCSKATARAHRVSEGGTEHGVLGQRFGAKFVAPVDKFVFGTRADWEGGLLKSSSTARSSSGRSRQSAPPMGTSSRRSTTTLSSSAPSTSPPLMVSMIVGHDGLTLKDFHQRAVKRGAALTLVEVAVLRMYTTLFFTSHGTMPCVAWIRRSGRWRGEPERVGDMHRCALLGCDEAEWRRTARC